MKRTRSKSSDGAEVKTLNYGGVRLDVLGHGSYWKNKKVLLTATEFSLLKTFLSQPERVFSRDQLMDLAYSGAVNVSDRTIDSHVRNLRSKYAKAGCKELIETLHGVGYKLGPCR